MRKHLFNIAAFLSLVVIFLIGLAWLTAIGADPRMQFFSLADGCHVFVDASPSIARLLIFNDASYGPYRGGIVSVVSPAAGRPSATKTGNFGDFAGVYYRVIRQPNLPPLWTCSISLLYPLTLACILPAVWLARHIRLVTPRRGFPIELNSSTIPVASASASPNHAVD